MFASAYILGLIIISLSSFFAWLTSWGNHKPGPLRLYLSAFLLPYLIWTLLSLINVDLTESGDSEGVPEVVIEESK